MQSENIDLTADGADYDIARGTTAYFHIATVSTDFAADIDTTATEAVQTQALAESCVITGNALRSGKAEVVGYVQPNKDGSNWVCGIVLTITEDAEAGDTLAFKVSDGALKGGNRYKLNVNVLVNANLPDAVEAAAEEGDSDENENNDKVIHIGTLGAGSSVEQGAEEPDPDAEEEAEAAAATAADIPVYWGATVIQIPTGADPLLVSGDVGFDSTVGADNGDSYTLTFDAACASCTDNTSPVTSVDPFSVTLTLNVLPDDEWRDTTAMHSYLED